MYFFKFSLKENEVKNNYIVFDWYMITPFEDLFLDQQAGKDLLGVGGS